MLIDLTTSVDCSDVDLLCDAVHCEQDAPVANARLPRTRAFRKQCGKTRIKRIFGKLGESCPDVTLR